MPPEYIAAVKAFASQDGVSFAEYVRDMFHDHILVRGAAFRERGAAFRD
jgi:predicted DNA binding CopG/RHH family protein